MSDTHQDIDIYAADIRFFKLFGIVIAVLALAGIIFGFLASNLQYHGKTIPTQYGQTTTAVQPAAE